MANLFKNLLYTGVGVAAQAKENIEKVVQTLIDEEKVSTKEGKRIVDEFLQNTDAKKENAEQELSTMVEKLVKTFSFATSAELTELQNRVVNLEALVARLETKAIGAPKTNISLPDANLNE